MNACSWHQSKKIKENPNLARQRKTNNSNKGIETKSIKRNQTETYGVKEMKKQKQKT